MAILITGGAGYIGSHTVQYLIENSIDVIVVDNLSTGHKAAVGVKFYEADIRDSDVMDSIFKDNVIDGVIHFAANSLVGESMQDPALYYHNNVYGMICLLETMKKHEVSNIVFSSTAATYGEPKRVPILETDDTFPTNPYGETKLAMEKMMKWYDVAYGIKYVSLRYFNAAGAHASGLIGEAHGTETHLIPLILQVANGQRTEISIFGEDYETDDGSCIRDYIHVMDLAKAHYLAYEFLKEKSQSEIFNLGSGRGFSVKEVIETARLVTKHAIPAVVKPRRMGDPAVLIASSEKAKTFLKWQPEHHDLATIIGDAWKWHSNHPHGYSR